MSRQGWAVVCAAPGCTAAPSRYRTKKADTQNIYTQPGSEQFNTCRRVVEPGVEYCPRHQFLLDHAIEIGEKKAAAKVLAQQRRTA